jgi:hypothetical protein
MVLQDQKLFHYFLRVGKDLSSHQVIEQPLVYLEDEFCPY